MFPLNFLYLDKLMVMFRNFIKFSPWKSPLFVRDSYRKALKVIDSCENNKHLEAASKYLNNFLSIQSEYIGEGHYEADEYVMNAYKRLRERYSIKKKLLLNE